MSVDITQKMREFRRVFQENCDDRWDNVFFFERKQKLKEILQMIGHEIVRLVRVRRSLEEVSSALLDLKIYTDNKKAEFPHGLYWIAPLEDSIDLLRAIVDAECKRSKEKTKKRKVA